jgi:hypothetical protein
VRLSFLRPLIRPATAFKMAFRHILSADDATPSGTTKGDD